MSVANFERKKTKYSKYIKTKTADLLIISSFIFLKDLKVELEGTELLFLFH